MSDPLTCPVCKTETDIIAEGQCISCLQANLRRQLREKSGEITRLSTELSTMTDRVRELRDAKQAVDTRSPDVQTAIDRLTAADEALFALLPKEKD